MNFLDKIVGTLVIQIVILELTKFQIAQNSELLQPLLGSTLKVLLHMLALNQSSAVLQHLFSTQRALVTKVNKATLIFFSCYREYLLFLFVI